MPLPVSSQQSSKQNRNNEVRAVSSFVDLLCDDTLMRVMAYADLASLVHFTRGISKSLRSRFHPNVDDASSRANCCSQLWRDVFVRHNLSPMEDFVRPNEDGQELQSVDYFHAIRRRLSLFSNLSGRTRRSKWKGGGGRKTFQQCFSLPNRYFYFMPLVPHDMMHYSPSQSNNDANRITFFDATEDENDNENDFDQFEQNDGHAEEQWGQLQEPPPVEFACDSYSLTSPGTGEEFVLLNPFSGSIEVYESVLDNAIGSEESMLEQAMFVASEGILHKRRRRGDSARDRDSINCDYVDLPDESSEDIAGEAIHHRLQQGYRDNMYDTRPKQVLFSVDDYFNLDLNEYFGQNTPFGKKGYRGQNDNRQGNVTVDWAGVASHIALKQDGKSLADHMIGAARILTMESDHNENELACTEVFAWSKIVNETGSKYGSKYVCRAAGSFYFLDICPNYKRLYASFQIDSCPFPENDAESVIFERSIGDLNRRLMDIDEESLVGGNGVSIQMSNKIYCLPFVKCNDSPSCPVAIHSYFSLPDACFVAQYPVSSFSVDPTGNILVVGTIYGTVEVWETGAGDKPCAPRPLQRSSVRESFLKRARSMTIDEKCNPKSGVSPSIRKDKAIGIEFDENEGEQESATQDDLALLENNPEEEFPHKHPTSKISQIFLPRHLPVQRCGFITKQHCPESGTTLLLWQTSTMFCDDTPVSTNERFQIMAMINLPLAAQCRPEVHFDGRRLIVFGKDHIGLILLVYHILSSRFDQHEFGDTKQPPQFETNSKRGSSKGEESGGVIHLHPKGEHRIKFVNRIRHAGLGGLEYYDSMLLTANERFLVVNTKTGNLIGNDGSRGASQGLLVIDLLEHGCY